MERENLSKWGALALILSAIGLAVFFSRPLAPSGKTVVRYLTYETGPEQMALVNRIRAAFERENPDMEVQVEFNNSARDKIYVELASGTAPDTFYAVTDDIPRLAVKGAIEALSARFAADKSADLGVYFPQVVRALRYDPPYRGLPKDRQEIYAFPIHFSTDVLFYNQSLFDAAHMPYPNDHWTWGQMIAAARKLTKKDADGRTTQFGFFLPSPDLTTTILGNNATVFNADYTRCTVNNPAAIQAVTALRDLRFKDAIAPDPAQLQASSSLQMFKLGQLAMLPGRTYMAVDFNKIQDFTYDAALMPGMKTNSDRLAVGGMCMSRQSKVKDAAWRWMKFYCSPKGGMQVLGREKNAVTAVKALAYSPDYFMQPPPKNAKVFVSSLKDAVITVPPIVNAAEYINAIRNPLFDDMLRSPDSDIPALMKKYEDQTNALLATEPKG